ncbi:MAG: RnfH family protein [Dehalococcoidia bacterium]|jgi:ribosomal 50S subunit-recycling heat shock protein|nr:RnfH family protein [Dehalococcoidia bacterium]
MGSFVAAEGGERLDHFLAAAAGVPRTQAQRLIAADRVTVNGEAVPRPAHRLKPGDRVEVYRPVPAPPPTSPRTGAPAGGLR